MPSSRLKRHVKDHRDSPNAPMIVGVETLQNRRKYPVTHPAVEAPLCESCAAYGLCFFDLDCEGCLQVVQGPSVSIAELFAVLRQWTRPVQIQLETIVEQMFARGANVNDRDGMTDMTLLHYAAKSGAQGEEGLASRMVSYLLDEGALLEARCKWTDMTPLHYSVYFDVPSAVEILLDRGADVRATCGELCRGGVLHIAAAQLALDSARVLVRRGAEREFTDARGRTPHDCLPSISELPENLITLRNHLATLLTSSINSPPTSNSAHLLFHHTNSYNYMRRPESGVLAPPVQGRISVYTPIPSMSHTMQQVHISQIDEDQKQEEQVVELDKEISSVPSPTLPTINNTSSYSNYEDDYEEQNDKEQIPPSAYTNRDNNYPQTDNRVSKPPNNALYTIHQAPQVHHSPGRVSAKVTLQALGMNLGDRVRICNSNTPSSPSPSQRSNSNKSPVPVDDSSREGILRYCGPVEFADGVWAGLEVPAGQGRNQGVVDGVRYFACQLPGGEGVFCPVTRLKPISGPAISNGNYDGSLRRRRPGTPRHALEPRGASVVVHHGSVDVSGVVARVDSGLTPASNSQSATTTTTTSPPTGISSTHLKVGDRVLVAGQRKGVVRFVGPAEFAPGLWFGIELDKAVGRNDGAVGGVRYFTCPENKGVFAPQSRLQKLRPKKEIANDPSRSSVAGESVSSYGDNRHSSLMTASQIQDSLPDTRESQSANDNSQDDTASNTSNNSRRSSSTTTSSIRRTSSNRSTTSSTSAKTKKPTKKRSKPHSNHTGISPLMTNSATVASNAPSYFGDASGAVYLREGLQVLCNNELGVIRYVGPTDFSPGVWCGIELRHSRSMGRNDGSVHGKRYFICPPGFGLMVRPARISVRGINGAHLVPPELQPLQQQIASGNRQA